jgi:hypothetical protein
LLLRLLLLLLLLSQSSKHAAPLWLLLPKCRPKQSPTAGRRLLLLLCLA